MSDKMLWFCVRRIWIYISSIASKNKVERPLHKVENLQFLKEPSSGLLRKSNGVEGSALWVNSYARVKFTALWQLTVNNKGSIYSLLELVY